jgi:hypothetical protein
MVISSRIRGAFKGTSSDVVYDLQNGQRWQQVGYRYRYCYRYSPRVTIKTSGSTGVMDVEGFSDPIKVRRIR